jgi:hypothetical protein
MITLRELLQTRGLSPSARIRIVRHRDPRWDLESLLQTGFFEAYQSWQSRPVFDRCDLLVSFLGEERSLARLIGVYSVHGRRPRGSARKPRGFPFPTMQVSRCFTYNLKPDERFSDLSGRVVIDWGRATRAWVQRFAEGDDREVMELRPKGRVRSFPGFLEFTLSYAELQNVLGEPDAHRDWHGALGSVGGVYLITDTKTGRHYVGSAPEDCSLAGELTRTMVTEATSCFGSWSTRLPGATTCRSRSCRFSTGRRQTRKCWQEKSCSSASSGHEYWG